MEKDQDNTYEFLCEDEGTNDDFPLDDVGIDEIETFPANCILRLEVTVQSNYHAATSKVKVNSIIQGTAFLVSNNQAITAAHNFNLKPDQAIIKIQVFFMKIVQNQIKRKPINVQLQNYRFIQRYFQPLSDYDRFEFDFALIKLDESIQRQKYIQIMPDFHLGLTKEPSLEQLKVTTYGFPGIKNQNYAPTMMKSQPHYLLLQIKRDGIILQHKISTLGGCSGCPILLLHNDEWYAISIHKGINNVKGFNWARILSTKSDNIHGNILQNLKRFSISLKTQTCQNILADRRPFSRIEDQIKGTFWDQKTKNFQNFQINLAKIVIKKGKAVAWPKLISKDKLCVNHSILIRNINLPFSCPICIGIIEQSYKTDEDSCRFDGYNKNSIGLMISKNNQGILATIVINDSQKVIDYQVDLSKDLILNFDLDLIQSQEQKQKKINTGKLFIPSMKIYQKEPTSNLLEWPNQKTIQLKQEYKIQNKATYYAFVSMIREGPTVEVEF